MISTLYSRARVTIASDFALTFAVYRPHSSECHSIAPSVIALPASERASRPTTLQCNATRHLGYSSRPAPTRERNIFKQGDPYSQHSQSGGTLQTLSSAAFSVVWNYNRWQTTNRVSEVSIKPWEKERTRYSENPRTARYEVLDGRKKKKNNACIPAALRRRSRTDSR